VNRYQYRLRNTAAA